MNRSSLTALSLALKIRNLPVPIVSISWGEPEERNMNLHQLIGQPILAFNFHGT